MMTPVCVGGRASVVVTGEDHDDSCLCWSSPRCVPGREDRPGASCLGGRNLDSLSVLSTNTTTTDQRDESGEMLPHLPQPHLSIPSLYTTTCHPNYIKWMECTIANFSPVGWVSPRSHFLKPFWMGGYRCSRPNY